MRAYVDCLLALLPFEPAAHRRLGGPPCFYVGHPLIERLAELRPDEAEAARRAGAPPLIARAAGLAPFGDVADDRPISAPRLSLLTRGSGRSTR